MDTKEEEEEEGGVKRVRESRRKGKETEGVAVVVAAWKGNRKKQRGIDASSAATSKAGNIMRSSDKRERRQMVIEDPGVSDGIGAGLDKTGGMGAKGQARTRGGMLVAQ